ncbi:MAG: tetratricopeptide repeat protein [Bacteroidales bacterium]|nr:tetratricopeptide repeat protein [Bacteroidales bacterium]
MSLLLLAFLSLSVAQKTVIYKNPEAKYHLGVELFGKEKYNAAQKQFTYVIESVEDHDSELRINAEYYDAICALELFNRDAEYKLTEFIKNHPTNSRGNLINFQLGRLAYRNRKYNSAQKYFDKVDIIELSSAQKDEYFFKTGYCYFKTNKLQKAKNAFLQVNNKVSKYSSPADYYLSHIAYTEGDYETALEGFNRLSQDKNFRSIAPYYIVQILFMQEKYDEVLDMAPALLENATAKRAPEIARIIGESYYRTYNYKEALPYLRQYFQTTRKSVSREDRYKFGFTLYKTDNFEDAVKNFQKVTGLQDSLSQYAYYYLADCYLQTGQKQFAANAFKSAYKLPFDKEIREDALFNHAQLAYELSYDPYSEAIRSLKEYLKNYPNSSRNDEAYNFLFNISMSTKNYRDAFEAIESIQKKGKDYNKDYQKISYYCGIELFNQFNYDEAILMFKKAIDLNENKSITAESIFWTGESFYRQSNLWGAKKYYSQFLKKKDAENLPVFNIANYNLGYIHFKRNEYSDALYYFKKFIAGLKNENPALVADAFLRMGDTRFISKQYDDALSYYNKAIKMNAIDVDYALFQKAITLGVLLRYDEKIKTLKKIITDYPNSSYTGEALFELGNTYLIVNDKENALNNFKKIESEYPNSSYAVKARLKSGLIYYNSDQNELALTTFKNVVSDYPSTPESKEALASIRNIYVDMNKVDEYLLYVQGLSFADVSISEQDSISYIAAENLYMEGNCENSLESFKKYLENFPEGAYIISAAYYSAECLVKSGKTEEALTNYELVLQEPKSGFTENSLLKAASISYSLESYEKAAKYYSDLEQIAETKSNITEARYGQMKCYFLLNNYEKVLVSTNKLLSTEKISEKMKLEALMIKAKSLLFLKDLLLAKAEFKDIVSLSHGEQGAEAKYNIAKIEYMFKDFENAEKDVFELINQYSAYDYWVAKGFILLADVYVQTDNAFQAKQTLQSIIENYDGDELKEIAKQKLDSITSEEKKEEELLYNNDSIYSELDTINIEGELIEVERF